MIKNILGIFVVGVFFSASLVAPVFAETSATSSKIMSKKEIAACMKTANTKKNSTYKTAQQAYNAALAKARTDYKNAIKTAGDVFKNENKMCKAVQKKTTVVELKAQNDSNITGKATLKEEGGKVKVSLELKGLSVGVAEPAHIHLGSCASIGGVKYPLTSAVDGKSETVLNVTLSQLASELPLAINVHKSVAESNIYVACGDLKF